MSPAAKDEELPTVKFSTGKDSEAPEVRAKLEAFGEEWELIRPNQIVAGKLVGKDGNINAGYIGAYLRAHIVVERRDEFEAAAEADEKLDIEKLVELMETLTAAVYEETPS